MPTRPTFLALAAAAALAACAPGPNAIAPAAMPAGLYDATGCAAARAERGATAARLAGLEAQQRDTATTDALAVLFIGLPVSGLTGRDVSGQIATERGRLIALDARLSRC
jgi:hypothetical protein